MIKYSKTHEWVSLNEEDLIATIGISEHAQEALGDITFIELPSLGQIIEKEKECAVIESVKAASDLFAPVSGEIVSINENLEMEPEVVNNSPYEEGWILKVKCSNINELDDLMDSNSYEKFLEEI